MNKSQGKYEKIIKHTLVVSLGAALGKITSIFREAIIASKFGATANVDAWVTAFSLLSLFAYPLQESTFDTGIVPTLTKYSNKKVSNALSSFFSFLLLLLAIMLVIGFFFAPNLIQLIAPGFTGKTLKLSNGLFLIILASLPFIGLRVFLISVLHAKEHFIAPAFAFVAINVVTLLSVLIFGKLGVYSIAFGMLAGAITSLLMQIPPILRLNLNLFPIPLKLSPDPVIKDIMRLMLPAAAATSVGTLNVIVDRAFASLLPAGSIAALNWGYSIMAAPIGIFAGSLSTVLFPRLSKEFEHGNKQDFSDSVDRGIRFSFLVAFPAAMIVAVFAIPIVSALFERGAFNRQATLLTATATRYYAGAIIGASAGTVLVRLFYAQRDVITPLVISASQVVLNAILDYILLKVIGFKGIPLATSFCSIAWALSLYTALVRKENLKLLRKSLFFFLSKVLAATALSGITMVVFLQKLGGYPLESSEFYRMAYVTVIILIASMVFLGSSLFLRIQEVKMLFSAIHIRGERHGS